MRQNYNKELKEIAKRKDNLVIFAGSGVAKECGLPNWEGLVEHLKKYLIQKGQSFDEQMNKYDLPMQAQIVYETFKEIFPTNYKNIFFSEIDGFMKPSLWPHTACQEEIIHTCEKIVTTNFDNSFESAIKTYCKFSHKKQNIYSRSFPKLNYIKFINSTEDYKVAYLHGNTGQHLIFIKDDYEKFYCGTNNTLYDFYKQLWQNNTLLFIGFSFEDYYVKEVFNKIFFELYERYNENLRVTSIEDTEFHKIKHFTFIQEYEDNKFLKLCEELKKMKIYTIPYKNHSEYKGYLDIINDSVRDTKSEWNPDNE